MSAFDVEQPSHGFDGAPYTKEEFEAEQARRKAEDGFGTFETRAPDDVPVLWQRETPTEARGQVLPFRRRE